MNKHASASRKNSDEQPLKGPMAKRRKVHDGGAREASSLPRLNTLLGENAHPLPPPIEFSAYVGNPPLPVHHPRQVLRRFLDLGFWFPRLLLFMGRAAIRRIRVTPTTVQWITRISSCNICAYTRGRFPVPTIGLGMGSHPRRSPTCLVVFITDNIPTRTKLSVVHMSLP